jgi:hypothetical protein
MTVRIRYRASDLGEGVVEEVAEANGYEILEDNTLVLHERWTDGNGRKKKALVGSVHRDRWDSVVVMSDRETE